MMPVLYVVGALLAALVVMSAWVFRSSNAPFLAKIILPVFAMGLAWVSPKVINSAIGYPVATTLEGLPTCFDIIAYSADDDRGNVFLWLLDGLLPRAYSLPLDDRISKGIKIFVSQWQPGASVRLCKDDGVRQEQYDSPAHNPGADGGHGGLHLDHPPASKVEGINQ